MERTVRMALGDYSGDGHGHYNIVTVIMNGDDLSDEKIAASYTHATDKLGFTPDDLCQQYMENDIPKDKYDALLAHGLVPSGLDGENHYDFSSMGCEGTRVEDEERISMTSLIMFYVGYNIPNFSWKYAPLPKFLIGGDNSIIRSNPLGYELFSED